MITDVSVNSHPDGEDDDNEHNNGDGAPFTASRSTSPASGEAQNSTRSPQGPQDPPEQGGPFFSLNSNPASGTTTPTDTRDVSRPQDPRPAARTRATVQNGGHTEAVNGIELERRKLQIDQLESEITDVVNARDQILQELTRANLAANEPVTWAAHRQTNCNSGH